MTLYCWYKAQAHPNSLEGNPLCDRHYEAEELRKDMAFLRELRLMAEERERQEEEFEGHATDLENK